MPILGRAKHALADRLGSAATAGEGTQNYLCGAQAAAVLAGLAVAAIWPGVWWFDPAIGLGIAGHGDLAGRQVLARRRLLLNRRSSPSAVAKALAGTVKWVGIQSQIGGS